MARSVADILRAENISRNYGNSVRPVVVLQNASIDIPRTSLIAVRGRSGSGKTTLLNILGALDRPDAGSVFFDEQEIASLSEKQRDEFRRTKIGFVFQSFGLIPYLTAYENVEFGLRIAGVPQDLWASRVIEALEFMGIAKRASHRTYEMSGGEQQRCAIARAIVHRPALVWADEPTAELDSKMARQVMMVFRRLSRELQISIVMTSHDTGSMEVADHVYAMESGQVVLERTSNEFLA